MRTSRGMSPRWSAAAGGASVGVCPSRAEASHDAGRADPDTRALRALLRDDRMPQLAVAESREPEFQPSTALI